MNGDCGCGGGMGCQTKVMVITTVAGTLLGLITKDIFKLNPFHAVAGIMGATFTYLLYKSTYVPSDDLQVENNLSTEGMCLEAGYPVDEVLLD